MRETHKNVKPTIINNTDSRELELLFICAVIHYSNYFAIISAKTDYVQNHFSPLIMGFDSLFKNGWTLGGSRFSQTKKSLLDACLELFLAERSGPTTLEKIKKL